MLIQTKSISVEQMAKQKEAAAAAASLLEESLRHHLFQSSTSQWLQSDWTEELNRLVIGFLFILSASIPSISVSSINGDIIGTIYENK